MEALHDVVRVGNARYLGASSMAAWQFAKAEHVAERHGWTRFVSMQDHDNLLHREEERPAVPGTGRRDPAWSRPIVGATNPGHLADALAATEVALSPDELARLEEPYVTHPVLGH